MCYIGGEFGITLKKLARWRGRDYWKEVEVEGGNLVHGLHAMVSFVPQPIEGDGIFVGNLEIYEWKEYAKKYGINAKNDAEFLAKFLDAYWENGKEELIKNLRKIEGEYAFCYYRDGVCFLARDFLGRKPLWFSFDGKNFAFSSEKKEINSERVMELHPRHFLFYDVKTKKLEDIYIPWKPKFGNERFSAFSLKELIKKALEKRCRGFSRIPILVSGGIDSSLLAILAKESKLNVYGVVVGNDYERAKFLEENFSIKLLPVEIDSSLLEETIYVIETSDPFKVETSLLLNLACKNLSEKLALIGSGGEELFLGYKRMKKALFYHHSLHMEILSWLYTIYERDLYRTDAIGMFNGVEFRYPLLDEAVVDYVFSVNENEIAKYGEKGMLLEILKEYGIKPERKAAQYSSGITSLLEKEKKKEGFATKAEWYKRIQKKFGYTNELLISLFSGGKDSALASYLMMCRNYPVIAFLFVTGKEEYPYLFDVKKKKLIEEFREVLPSPLWIVEMEKPGKEKEKEALLSFLLKKKYAADGIVVGGVASSFQRNAFQEICERIGWKFYSPLWYIDEEEVWKILWKKKFEVILWSTDIEDLSQHRGKKIDKNLLPFIRKKRINLVGEGGEFETLVISAPFYKRKISLLYREGR